MVDNSLNSLVKDLRNLDVIARVPNRNDPDTPHVHRMLAAGLIATAVAGRIEPGDEAAIERAIHELGVNYAATLRVLDRLAPPPG